MDKSIILLLGLLVVLLPLGTNSMNAMGITENEYYKDQYNGDDNYKSKDQYNGDDNYKSKDSNSVSITKLNCINTNININGDNSGNVNVGNRGQLQTPEVLTANTYSGDNNDERNSDNGYNKNHKDFDCLINNNNTNTNIVSIGGGNATNDNATNGNEPETCEECYRAILDPDQLEAILSGGGLTLTQLCDSLLSGGIEVSVFINGLIQQGVSPTDAQNLADCLIRIGVPTTP